MASRRREAPQPAEMPMTKQGDTIGYLVVCWDPPGQWTDTWDGTVHPTKDEGVAALRLCSQHGYPCVLAKIVREYSDTPADPDVVAEEPAPETSEKPLFCPNCCSPGRMKRVDGHWECPTCKCVMVVEVLPPISAAGPSPEEGR